ncbi:MAG TPA: DUF3240 family protein [Gammaproteobacteria bacterium]
MSECLLVIVATPAIEESLVDWLLERREISGFSSSRIDGHGSRQSELSLAEQVTGRQRKVMFHIHADCEQARTLLDALKQAFSGAGLHYWMMPLLEAGQIH